MLSQWLAGGEYDFDCLKVLTPGYARRQRGDGREMGSPGHGEECTKACLRGTTSSVNV